MNSEFVNISQSQEPAKIMGAAIVMQIPVLVCLDAEVYFSMTTMEIGNLNVTAFPTVVSSMDQYP